jgi:hypothetical protein
LTQGDHLPEAKAGSWSYSAPESASHTGTNLSVSHDGVTKVIAEVSFDENTTRVSPDGRWFAFMSDRELTGYNTHDAVSGKPDEEVYLYHAPEDLASEAGTLVCASCDPTGARPVGRESAELADEENGLVVPQKSAWADNNQQWIAGYVPESTPYTNNYHSRYLLDGGRLFFDSNDALVPQDVNGNEDVYEYEPAGYKNTEGKTDCTTVSALYSPRSGGCVGLVSSGQATGESAFVDASGSGADVFFLTTARLVPQDYDNAYDVYDARECTSQTPCYPAAATVPPPCETGDACKPAPTPQPTIFGSAPSATFSGPGNVTPPPPAVVKPKPAKKTVKCKKGTVHKGNRCVKRSKTKKRAKKSSRDRRAQS